MRILLISDILLTGDFAIKLQQEGNEVRVFIEDPRNKNNLDNLLAKTDSWRNELDWVGKDGLIIFEDAGLGKEQDALRAEGYTVLGGSELGERTETDREFGQQVFALRGLPVLPVSDFTSQHAAIDYLKEHPSAWVLK
jgi:phosphoribosylamine--glycine ligase